MTMRRVVLTAACLVGMAGMAFPVSAQSVKMYNAPPSVEELKSVLGGGGKGSGKVKFRKLELGDDAASVPPASEQPSTSTTYASPPPSASSGGASGGGASGQAIGFPINFAYNSAEIDPTSRPFLDTVGQLLSQQQDMRLLVEGHTDATGSPGYNLSLSERRAASVKRYLSGRFGIDPSRLLPVGKGQSEPLTQGDPLNPQNRRVQFRPLG